MYDRNNLLPAKVVSNYTIIAAIFAFAGWALTAYGYPLLAAAAILAVYSHGLICTVIAGRAARRADGAVPDAEKLRLAFLITVTLLFTGWTGWVTVAGVGKANSLALFVVLFVALLFAIFVEPRVRKAGSELVVDSAGRYSNITIRLVDDPVSGPLFEVDSGGVTVKMDRNATARTVVESVGRGVTRAQPDQE